DRATPTHYVHFLPNAKVVNADSKLHVDGFVARSGNGPFLLPTGDGDQLHPIGIDPSSPSAMVKAAYVNPLLGTCPTLPTSDSVFEYTLLHVNMKEYWQVRANATSNLTLSWNEESQLGNWIQSVDSLVIAGWNGKIWKNLGQAYVEGSIIEGRIQSFSIDLGEFEAISLGKNSFEGERPESWISFDGGLFRNDIQLNWKLAYENYTEKYIVERAIDRRFFQSIGEVEASKSGTAMSSYRYIDPKIAEDSPVDALYYRLKKVGIDAAFSYSSIIEIGLDIRGNVNLLLYPNPAVSTIILELDYLPFNTRLEIFNTLGQDIHMTNIMENQTEIDVSDWPDGQYYAVVKQEGYSITKKFYVYH
ncbi:MAG: T9SS type A sorting domain-containing protein, partial [Bacteroidota bacterium]